MSVKIKLQNENVCFRVCSNSFLFSQNLLKKKRMLFLHTKIEMLISLSKDELASFTLTTQPVLRNNVLNAYFISVYLTTGNNN